MANRVQKAVSDAFDGIMTLVVTALVGAVIGTLLDPQGGVIVGAAAALVGHVIHGVKVRLNW